jgi:hypothetical protein
MLIEIRDRFCVEFDKGLGLEFFSCFAESCFGDNVLGDNRAGEDFPKLVEFRLVGAFNEVTEIQNKCGKRQFSVAAEIWCLLAVSFDKILRKDDFLNVFNNIGTSFGKQVLCQSVKEFQIYQT